MGPEKCAKVRTEASGSPRATTLNELRFPPSRISCPPGSARRTLPVRGGLLPCLGSDKHFHRLRRSRAAPTSSGPQSPAVVNIDHRDTPSGTLASTLPECQPFDTAEAVRRIAPHNPHERFSKILEASFNRHATVIFEHPANVDLFRQCRCLFHSRIPRSTRLAYLHLTRCFARTDGVEFGNHNGESHPTGYEFLRTLMLHELCTRNRIWCVSTDISPCTRRITAATRRSVHNLIHRHGRGGWACPMCRCTPSAP